MTIDPGSKGWLPDACTLPTAEQPVRVAEFDDFFTSSVRAATRLSRTRLDLVLADGTEPAARELAAKETSCCSFFSFTFHAGETGLVMQVAVPSSYVAVLDAFEQRVLTRVNQ